jgi:hypothetical protein
MAKFLGSFFVLVGSFMVGCSTAHYCWMTQTCVLEKQLKEKNT